MSEIENSGSEKVYENQMQINALEKAKAELQEELNTPKSGRKWPKLTSDQIGEKIADIDKKIEGWKKKG